jgi:hypothetical protein
VAHFRVIASEVVFGVNFLAISLEILRYAQQLTNLFMFLYQKGVRSQKFSHQVTLSAVHWQVAPLHQPLSPTTSSVVPGVSSSPRTLFSERHFWGAVRTLTLTTSLTLWVTLSFNNLRYAEGISAELVECGALEDLSPYREHWFDTNVWGSIFDRCMWSVPNVILNRYVL